MILGDLGRTRKICSVGVNCYEDIHVYVYMNVSNPVVIRKDLIIV